LAEGATKAYRRSVDIRTKLVFALVSVALLSMLALGFVLFMTADEALREGRLAQLDGLAESRKDAVQQIVSGWRDRVRLIASRTQLRESLRTHEHTPDAEVAARISRILEDVREAVDVVEAVVVYDTDGRAVASTGALGDGLAAPTEPWTAPPSGEVNLVRLDLVAPGRPRVALATGLTLDGEPVGSMWVALDARPLLELTSDRTSLGVSGETVLVLPGPGGALLALRSSGLEPAAPESDPLVRFAAEGVDGTRWQSVTDAAGVPVWVATRNVPELGWTLVVKVDAAEARAPVFAFRDRLVRIALSLAAFAILVGTVLGLWFARPIHDLAEVARRVGAGELHARAEVQSEDEVGLLARTFNEMAAELEQRVAQLREFERFFAVSLDMMCIAGTDGYFKRVNPAFTRILGWSEEDLLSKPFLDFIHPDDVATTRRELTRLERGIPTISFENRYQIPDGTYRILAWTSYPDPQTNLLYAIARDVTDDRREREERDELSRRLARAEAKLRAGP
jgi:PAS domain S-box-containing protein